jgi:hypothetical protein
MEPTIDIVIKDKCKSKFSKLIPLDLEEFTDHVRRRRVKVQA